MPDKCLSCGECAVIEDDIEGGGVQSICIECGTVASGVKNENVSTTAQVKIENSATFVVKHEPHFCESCGDSLPLSVQSDVKICPECQELELGSADTNEQVAATHSETKRESGNTSEPVSSSSKCKSCGSTNLSMDSMGSDERLVCRDCGTVAESEALMNDEFEIMSRSYRNSFLTLPKHAGQPKKLRGRVAGHEKIAFLCNKFCFPEFIKEEALEMFDRIFEKPSVYYAHVTTKEHLAAACVFIVCRQHDIPVSLVHFRKYVDRFSTFLKGRKVVLKCLNTFLPNMTLSCQVEHFLSNCGFNATIISKVKDVLFLCRQAWLTQGRSREGLIIIATYYAYVSSEKCTRFISMAKFRRMFKFPNISMVLQAECNSIFLKLARSIPWVLAKDVKPTTIYKYIDDILKYQNCLFQLAFRSEENDNASYLRNISETDKALDDKQKQTMNAQLSNNMPVNKRSGVFEKEVLLPSILKKPRQEVLDPEIKVSSQVDLDSPEVKASEFNEDEISSYLLSPEEEAQLRTPKLMFM